MDEMEELDDNQLHEISLERGGRRNKYTRDALRAQKILYRRKQCGMSKDSQKRENRVKLDRSYYSKNKRFD